MSALTCARDVCHMFQGRQKGRPIWPLPGGKQKELEGVAQQGRNFFVSLTNFPSRRYQPMLAREGGREFSPGRSDPVTNLKDDNWRTGQGLASAKLPLSEVHDELSDS